MIYPKNFESKIGFQEIRTLLRGRCLSAMGADEVDNIEFSSDVAEINRQLATVKEFRSIMEGDIDFPTQNFNDLRSTLVRLQVKGTYMDEAELFNLRNTLATLSDIIEFLRQGEEIKPQKLAKAEAREGAAAQERNIAFTYPLLARMAEEVECFPRFIVQVDSILNNYGKMKDDASPELLKVRQLLVSARRSASLSLRNVLQRAQESGYVEKDVTPTYRDGRLVIPVKPALKRKIRGIQHDESATGKTVFIEPQEVVEANNRIRSLEAEEQRAIIMILQAMAEIVRPQIPQMMQAFAFLGRVDFVRAKAILADKMDASEPMLSPFPTMSWQGARHPLLETSLRRQGREIMPLDIALSQSKRLLLISGPNAGGKSVCLKTVALLQYMMQCGLSVPMKPESKAGAFDSLFIDIGDEQSIEDDLSTYSSHLLNMKNMMKLCSGRSLILIDEFGGGTEPQIGAAIAQAMLEVFLNKSTYGVITTHYQNLKYYADNHEGIVNGAMLYDRHEMRPLFQLQIGNPGSSFAIEIARSIGLPQQVIEQASKIVGDDYIKSDKYLQDIVRDKRYWENKRLAVHQKERTLEQMIEGYEKKVRQLENERKSFMAEAKDKAETLFRESNAIIENTIRSIREAQADKEETRRLRSELDEVKTQILDNTENPDDSISRKMEQIRRRRERREMRKRRDNADAANGATEAKAEASTALSGEIKEGSYVKIKGGMVTGRVIKLTQRDAVVQSGAMKLTVGLAKLELTDAPEPANQSGSVNFISRQTRESMHQTRMNFRSDIDLRGMSGQEALEAVTYFIEDAIQCGASRLRILHGTGTGYLRQVIRQYLRTVAAVQSYHDEHIQFGGAGITVVEMAY